MSGALFCFPRIKMQWSKPFYISKRFHSKYRRPGMKAGKH